MVSVINFKSMLDKVESDCNNWYKVFIMLLQAYLALVYIQA